MWRTLILVQFIAISPLPLHLLCHLWLYIDLFFYYYPKPSFQGHEYRADQGWPATSFTLFMLHPQNWLPVTRQFAIKWCTFTSASGQKCPGLTNVLASKRYPKLNPFDKLLSNYHCWVTTHIVYSTVFFAQGIHIRIENSFMQSFMRMCAGSMVHRWLCSNACHSNTSIIWSAVHMWNTDIYRQFHKQ